MSYKHILLAIDLTEDNQVLIEQGITLAKQLDAEVTIFHNEADYEEMCRGTGFIDADLSEGHKLAKARIIEQFNEITNEIEYPIKRRLIGTGEYGEQLRSVLQEYKPDLVICGHHHGFWSSISSSTGKLINILKVPILVIPLEE